MIAINPDPVHLAVHRDLFLPDNRNIVLGLARDRANTAADAGPEINRHAPGMALINVIPVEGVVCRRWRLGRARDAGLVALEFGESPDADLLAPVHLPMFLGSHQL